MNITIKQTEEIHMILGPEWIIDLSNELNIVSFKYKPILNYEIIFSKQLLEFRLIEINKLWFVKNVKKNNNNIDVELGESDGYILK